MKNLRFLSWSCLLVLILIAGCRKVDLEPTSEKKDGLPSCVQTYIDTYSQGSSTNFWAQVWRWEDGVNTYYYMNSPCCDMYNFLYDDECQIVCAPSGGFAGDGDGRCPQWAVEPVKTLVWQGQ
jgi:hypothetical protein